MRRRAWSIKDALWWAQNFDIDGCQLDAIKHVPMEWLEDLRESLNTNITDREESASTLLEKRSITMTGIFSSRLSTRRQVGRTV